MKKVLAVAFATMFMLASVPAFACGGDKTAKKDDAETLMTSVDDGAKVDDAKKAKKAKTKDAKKEEADDEKSETEGEV